MWSRTFLAGAVADLAPALSTPSGTTAGMSAGHSGCSPSSTAPPILAGATTHRGTEHPDEFHGKRLLDIYVIPRKPGGPSPCPSSGTGPPRGWAQSPNSRAPKYRCENDDASVTSQRKRGKPWPGSIRRGVSTPSSPLSGAHVGAPLDGGARAFVAAPSQRRHCTTAQVMVFEEVAPSHFQLPTPFALCCDGRRRGGGRRSRCSFEVCFCGVPGGPPEAPGGRKRIRT